MKEDILSVNPLENYKFEHIEEFDNFNKFSTFKLDYYEKKLDVIEDLIEGEMMVGNIKVKRQFVKTNGEDMFTLHTNIRDMSYSDEELKATLAIVHGFGEHSDIFLECAIAYALNGLDVHLIDLRGYGLCGGFRMVRNKISDY